MDTKTLGVIQKLARLGKILSKITAIISIVGGAFCLVGILSVAVGNFDVFKIGGVTIHSIIANDSNMTMGTMYAAMSAGVIICAGEAVIAKLAERFFKKEIAAGTPFDFNVAKEMKRLGICIISISVGTVIAASICNSVIGNYIAGTVDLNLDFSQAGTGIAFIITSIICKFGAEREAAE